MTRFGLGIVTIALWLVCLGKLSAAPQPSTKSLSFLSQALSVTCERANVTTRSGLGNCPLPKHGVAQVSVAAEKIAAPHTVEDLVPFLERIHQLLAVTKESQVTLTYGDYEAFPLRLPFLGQGQNGVVFAMTGAQHEGQVLKLSLPKLSALDAAIQESKAAEFWQEQVKGRSFGVPRQVSSNPLGLFRLMEKNNGETLTKALLRFGLLTIDAAQHTKTSYNLAPMTGPYQQEIKKIADAVLDMIEVSVAHPQYCPSLSPNNIHVTYTQTERYEVASIDLVDIGPVVKKCDTYRSVTNFADYLAIAADRLAKYLREPQYTYDKEDLLRFHHR